MVAATIPSMASGNVWLSRAEGSASDEAHPSEENRRADRGVSGGLMWPGRAEGSASDEAHPSEENRRADERGHH